MDTDATRRELQPLVDLVRAERYDAAIAGLQEFLAQHSDNEVAIGLLGAAYFQIGMLARAQSCYRRVMELNPANPLARFQLGMLHFSQQEHRVALETWAPLLGSQQDFMAHFHSALALVELGETARARELLEVAGRNMPLSHPLFAQLKAIRARLSGEAP